MQDYWIESVLVCPMLPIPRYMGVAAASSSIHRGHQPTHNKNTCKDFVW